MKISAQIGDPSWSPPHSSAVCGENRAFCVLSFVLLVQPLLLLLSAEQQTTARKKEKDLRRQQRSETNREFLFLVLCEGWYVKSHPTLPEAAGEARLFPTHARLSFLGTAMAVIAIQSSWLPQPLSVDQCSIFASLSFKGSVFLRCPQILFKIFSQKYFLVAYHNNRRRRRPSRPDHGLCSAAADRRESGLRRLSERRITDRRFVHVFPLKRTNLALNIGAMTVRYPAENAASRELEVAPSGIRFQ